MSCVQRAADVVTEMHQHPSLPAQAGQAWGRGHPTSLVAAALQRGARQGAYLGAEANPYLAQLIVTRVLRLHLALRATVRAAPAAEMFMVATEL